MKSSFCTVPNAKFHSCAPGRAARGMSLTEIMIGVALFMLAIVPSISYLLDAFKQTSGVEMDNTAANIAESIFKNILEGTSYDDVQDGMKLDRLSGVNDEDGAENNQIKVRGVVYNLEVKVKTYTNDEVTFSFRKTPYIRRQTGNNQFAEADNDIDKIRTDAKRWNVNPVKLKLKDIVRHKDKTFLKEIYLCIKWKDPKTKHDRKHEFISLKANLTLVKTQGG